MYKIRLSPYAEIFYNEWLLRPQSSLYNIVIDQKWHGDLDVPRLVKALKRYVAEHVILNSHIQNIDGNPYWVPNAHVRPLESFPLAKNKVDLGNYAYGSFDLGKGPLYRFRLVQLKKDEYRFIAVYHHIVVDGSSTDSGIFEAIANYYNDPHYTTSYDRETQISLLTELTHNLFETLQQQESAAKQFWAQQLADTVAIDLGFLKLTQGTKAKKHSTIGELNFSYDKDVVAKVNQIKRKYVITPYAYGQCIFALLIYQYTGQESFVINYATSIKEGMNFIFGAQVNTNLIPFKFTSTTTMVAIFNQSRKFFESLKTKDCNYGYYPITKIIQDSSDKKLLNLCFIRPHFKNVAFKLQGIKATVLNRFNIDALDPMVFEQELHDGIINYRIRYDKTILNETLVTSFVAAFKKLFLEVLADLIAGNETKLTRDYSPLDAEQYHKIVYKLNETSYDVAPQKTICDLFTDQVFKTPESTAIIYQDTRLTYQELHELTDNLAAYLQQHYAVQPNDLLAIYLDRSEYLIIAILAVLKAGGAYVPINPSLPFNMVNYIILDTNAKVVLTSEKYKLLLENKVADIELIDIVSLKCPQGVPQKTITSDNLAYIIYTSGSTGKPKGVLQLHDNVVRLFVATQNLYHFAATDVWVLFHLYSFDFSVWEMWGALFYGGKLVIPTTEQISDIELFYRLCQKEEVTVLNQTPQVFYCFIDMAVKQYCANRLKKLRYVIFGGDALNVENLKAWFELYGDTKPKLVNMYGITETTVHVTYKEIKKSDVGRHSYIGRPIPDQKAYVLNNNLVPVPIGVLGELYIGGARLAVGYLNHPKLTEERFINNPFQTAVEQAQGINGRLYKTGDVVRLLPNGGLEYIARNDSQVKIRGYRTELGEIESVLLRHPTIKQAIVILKSKEDRKYLLAYYAAEKEIAKTEIQAYLAAQLPKYMLPAEVIYLTKFPLTANGKIDIKVLPEPRWYSNKYQAPTNQQEQLVCNEFAKVLGISRIGIDDDFFDLGGDSLKVIALVAKLQKNLDVKVADIFNLRTPREIAENSYFGSNVLKQKLEQVKSLYKNRLSQAIVSEKLQQKLDDYYDTTNTLQVNCFLRKPIKNVLLTGATGYLGCNILNQLLTWTDYKIFVLVRADTVAAAVARLEKKFYFYFAKTLGGYLNTRIFVLKGDLEKKYLALSLNNYKALATKIDSIIHAAALVKHYGEYSNFYSANVQATVSLLKLALLTELKDFHYISTYSVLDFATDYVCTEFDVSAKVKDCQNVYIQTKLLAERQVNKYRKVGVKASIYRLGNLAFMSSNYRIQENANDNAFYSWLQCVLKMRCIASEIDKVEISPVDLTAKAIVKLFDKEHLSNEVYHIFNPFLFSVSQAITGNPATPSITVLDIEQFINNVLNHLNNSLYHDLIVRFLLRQGWLEDIDKRRIFNKILQDKTQKVLKQLDFFWQPVSDAVFNKFVELLNLQSVARTEKKVQIFEHLGMIAPLIPANVYWFNTNNILLGANERTLKAVGGSSIEDFVGKNPYEYYPKEIASDIIKHHEEAVRSGKTFSQEESIRDFTTGEIKYFDVIIAPLRDDEGIVVGSIGISVEITSDKKNELLVKENEEQQQLLQLQKAQLEQADKIRVVTAQVAHDINSPLASLRMLVRNLQNVDENTRIAIRNATNRITDIANNLVIKYGSTGEIENAKINILNSELISLLISNILSEKRTQYVDKNITFELHIADDAEGLFARVNQECCKRAISNIINNAVEAIIRGKKKQGVIEVNIAKKADCISIEIKDNGCGIPGTIIKKLGKTKVSTKKETGHGIGVSTAIEYLKAWGGDYQIESQENVGTIFTMWLPIAVAPNWFQAELTITTDNQLIILDDDQSIHDIWNTRFHEHADKLQHFNNSEEMLAQSATFKNAVYLIDYELFGSKLNGIEVIKELQPLAPQAIYLVTSRYEDDKIKTACLELNIKIIPKNFAPYIPITIQKSAPAMPVDYIFIDDDVSLIDIWELDAAANGKKIAAFSTIKGFEQVKNQYDKGTPIYIDYVLGMEDGIKYSKQLAKEGFNNLYIATGYDKTRFTKPMPWLKDIVGKEPPK